jgi:hypothetical protein
LTCSQRRERKGRRREQGGFRAAAAAAGERGEEEKEGGEGWLTGGPRLSAPRGKKKKGRGSGGLARGWAGPPGPKGAGAVFVFFLFLFQTSFSQEFYRLFRNHTSNQKPCKPKDDAHTLVVSKFIKLSLMFLELNLNSNLISLNP